MQKRLSGGDQDKAAPPTETASPTNDSGTSDIMSLTVFSVFFCVCMCECVRVRAVLFLHHFLPFTFQTGVPFARWDNEQVACWLHDIGLNHYVSHCKSWAKNGETLLNASNKNMEQDLGIKNPLHR